MILDDATTISPWTDAAPAQRPVQRRRNRDLDAAHGIVLAAVTGVAILAWTVAIVEWVGR